MPRRAVICATTETLSEMRDLLSSLGYYLDATVVQRRDHPDPRTFLGSGKVEELARELAAGDVEADLVVVAGDLRASQVIALERALDRPVYDRVRLILEIFRDRAHSEAAKLQVELAQLHYELPILREAIHQAKSGERPGFLSGGATAFATQLEPVRTRMAKIRGELQRIRGERGLRRKHRKREGFWQVSLAGYTNAGKSTLLNAVTAADVVTEDRLFSTLETRTRRVHAPRSSRSRVLMTDTVGFIEDLPPWLVEAFHATLEEIAFADLVLLIVDGSEALDEVERKLSTSLAILRGFLAERDRPDLLDHLFLVFNKVDAAPDARPFHELADDWGFPDRHAVVSARTAAGLDDLLVRMRAAIPDRRVVEVDLPMAGESYALIDRLDAVGELEDVSQDGRVFARVGLPTAQVEKVRNEVDRLGGTMAQP